MASFPQASPPTPCAHLYPPPYALHALHISFVSILPPAQYWVRGTNRSAPRYAALFHGILFTLFVLFLLHRYNHYLQNHFSRLNFTINSFFSHMSLYAACYTYYLFYNKILFYLELNFYVIVVICKVYNAI